MADHLHTLYRNIRRCRLCLEKPRGKPLPHAPNPVVVLSETAQIAICGQAPGNKVNISGIPFTDPSGDRLRQWLGVSEAQFYDPANFAIVPMGFCFPGYDANGGDLPPRKECAGQWHQSVFEAMPQLKVKLLVGGSAQKYHLGSKAKKTVTETAKAWRSYLDSDACLPMPHPSWRNTAWIRRNAWFSNDLLPVLRELIQVSLNRGR